MKTIKSAKISMIVFLIYRSLKKIENINFDYVAFFDVVALIVVLIGTVFFNFANNMNAMFCIIIFCLISLPLTALMEKIIRMITKKMETV